MKAKVLPNGRFIRLIYESKLERRQTIHQFTRKVENWKFRAQHVPGWNGDIKFVKGRGSNKLYVGLWKELKSMCERFDFPLKIQESKFKVIDKDLSKEEVFDFCRSLISKMEGIGVREDQQIDAVYKAIKYRFCMLDISQNAGKTLIQWLLMVYLLEHKEIGGKALIICPDLDLVVQNFEEYREYSGGRHNLNVCQIHGKSKTKDITNYGIVIGTFQKLSNFDKDFFNDFTLVIADECHRANAKSIRNIVHDCSNSRYRFGMSGSIKESKYADYYNLLALFGPVVKQVSKLQTIKKGYSAPIVIKVIKLMWANKATRQKLADKSYSREGEEMFRLEQKLVRRSKARLRWLCEFIARLDGNTIVFFIDVKGGYGKKIASMIREISSKKAYYIDGDVDNDVRLSYKQKMEEGSDKVLVASYDTYSTGKSINNLHYGLCAESRKSFYTISQAIGRGMRTHKNKEKFVWIDIADDLSIEEDDLVGRDYKSYMMKHLAERKRHYENEGLKVSTKEIDLRKSEMFETDVDYL